MNKIISVTVDGRELPLLFSLQAETDLVEALGSMDVLFDSMRPHDAEDDEIAAAVAAQAKQRGETPVETLRDAARLVPLAIACLANAGWAYRDSDETITARWVAAHTVPADLELLSAAMVEAINAGLTMSHQAGTGKRDLVLEQIEKN